MPNAETAMPNVVLQTEIRDFPVKRGKVRDVYDLGDDLLIVATDRISAFDVVLPTGIPCKGQVLTQMSVFWFERFADLTPSHYVSAPASATEVALIDEALGPHVRELVGRTMLVRKAKVLPVECVVRGYLAGSGWKSYRATGEVCGVKLPPGLEESSELPEPIFTPTTKAETGHDKALAFECVCEMVGEEVARQVRDKSIAIYSRARDYAAGRGVIICDTKFEWGLADSRLILVDEVLTPDSSRFWPAEGYAPGGPQPSYDKQFVRDWLEASGWNKTPPAPELPPDVVAKTSAKYIEAYEKLTGKKFVAR
jgi:phosphoribosylaminoimidazole-succinocarboxamide synthase